MLTEIEAFIIAYTPLLVTIISTIVMVCKILKSFKDLKEEVKQSKEMQEIRDQVKIVIQENYKLKKQINQLIEKVDKVKMNEVEDERDNTKLQA